MPVTAHSPRLACLATTITLMATAPAFGQTGVPTVGGTAPAPRLEAPVISNGFYVGVNLGASIISEPELTDSGAGLLRVSGDVGANVNGFLGYRFHPAFRVEGEVGYRNWGIDEIATGNVTSPGRGNLTAFSFMANAYADFGRSEFRPYLGVGLGFAEVDADSISFGGTSLPDADDLSFSYQVMVGVSYLLNPNWAVSAGYRYQSFEEFDILDSLGTETSVNGIGSHNFMAGLRYHF